MKSKLTDRIVLIGAALAPVILAVGVCDFIAEGFLLHRPPGAIAIGILGAMTTDMLVVVTAAFLEHWRDLDDG